MKKKIIALLMSVLVCAACMLPAFALNEEDIEPATGESSTQTDGENDSETTETTEAAAETESTTAAPAEETTQAAEEEATTASSGLSLDISLEDILNSSIVQGIMGSDGFLDITNIVLELMGTLNKENLEAMGKEEAQKLVQSTFDSVAGMITQMYENKDLYIVYDPLEVMGNLFDLDTSSLTTQKNETTSPDDLVIGPGDVDGDGKITAADARLILRRAAQLITFTTEQEARADVDKDGKVTAADARIVLRVSAELETL